MCLPISLLQVHFRDITVQQVSQASDGELRDVLLPRILETLSETDKLKKAKATAAFQVPTISFPNCFMMAVVKVTEHLLEMCMEEPLRTFSDDDASKIDGLLGEGASSGLKPVPVLHAWIHTTLLANAAGIYTTE